MNKLKALRNANEGVIGKLGVELRIKLTAAYSKRLGQLGASMEVAQ